MISTEAILIILKHHKAVSQVKLCIFVSPNPVAGSDGSGYCSFFDVFKLERPVVQLNERKPMV